MGAFYAREILDAVIQIEQNGRIFYEKVADAQDNKEVRDLFSFLADQESKHIRECREFGEGLAPIPDDMEREDFGLYLNNLTAENVFKEDGSGESLALRVKTETEAVDLGIRFEKEALLLLHEFRTLIRSKESDFIDGMIQWERGHLVKLVRLKRSLEDKTRG